MGDPRVDQLAEADQHPPGGARVPLRRSVVTRLLAMSLAVCAVSVAATAWLVVSSTDAAIEQVNGQNLRDDAVVYNALLDWAASHPDWSGVAPLLTRLAGRTSYRLLLTDVEGVLLAESDPPPSGQPAPAVDLADTRVIVDPGQVDWLLLQHAPGMESAPHRTVSPTWSAQPVPTQTRAEQDGLDPHGPADTAPPARLFITGRQPVATTFVDLSAPSRARIAGLAALVLAAAGGISIAVGLRITRPLRELATAARRMADGDDEARVRVRSGDEIGAVAAVFNSLAAQRSEQERLRRAMVGDVAHELRTPLSNLRGWLEAAQDGLAPFDEQLVASLHEEALQLQHLVADLQDLSLGDAGELRLHVERLDLGSLLEQVVRGHGAVAAAKGVALGLETTPGLALDADPVRLRQAVTNLVANAVRHTPSGGSVHVSGRMDEAVTETAAGPGLAVIEVTDTGEGISSEDLPLVFERFWRADKARARESGGTGLGLAIVRQVADLHGGSVTGASQPGTGSRFTMTLPVSPPATP